MALRAQFDHLGYQDLQRQHLKSLLVPPLMTKTVEDFEALPTLRLVSRRN